LGVAFAVCCNAACISWDNTMFWVFVENCSTIFGAYARCCVFYRWMGYHLFWDLFLCLTFASFSHLTSLFSFLFRLTFASSLSRHLTLLIYMALVVGYVLAICAIFNKSICIEIVLCIRSWHVGVDTVRFSASPLPHLSHDLISPFSASPLPHLSRHLTFLFLSLPHLCLISLTTSSLQWMHLVQARKDDDFNHAIIS